MKYRVKEFDGKFDIQVEAKVKQKKYFWQPTNYQLVWKGTNYEGQPHRFFRHISEKYSKTFDNLESAMDQIKSWQKGVIIHYPKL